jgi:REP element-mobilizing transposase RayT
MNNYNPDIHHRRSIRLKGYDYSQEGLYFITICLQDRKCLFGEIVGVENIQPHNFKPENFQTLHFQPRDFQPRQKMILNDTGKIAVQCWLDIPKHFPNVVLHEYIVMPNHVHGIIELIKSVSPNVGAENILPLHHQPRQNEYQKIIPHSIGSIVRGYKTGVTKWFRNNSVGAVGVQNIEPRQHIWQRNYYEQIIRNQQSYSRITDYIIKNPDNWKKDDFFDCR